MLTRTPLATHPRSLQVWPQRVVIPVLPESALPGPLADLQLRTRGLVAVRLLRAVGLAQEGTAGVPLPDGEDVQVSAGGWYAPSACCWPRCTPEACARSEPVCMARSRCRVAAGLLTAERHAVGSGLRMARQT